MVNQIFQLQPLLKSW